MNFIWDECIDNILRVQTKSFSRGSQPPSHALWPRLIAPQSKLSWAYSFLRVPSNIYMNPFSKSCQDRVKMLEHWQSLSNYRKFVDNKISKTLARMLYVLRNITEIRVV